MRWYSMATAALLASACAVTTCARETVRIPASSFSGSIQAEVYAPSGPALGAVVALHGCGGLYSSEKNRSDVPAARHDVMGKLLADAGYAAVFPDSLGSRGLGSICRQGTPRKIDEAQRAADARDAIAWVKAQPWGTSLKIAVLGWSHGGSTVLEAIDLRNPPTGAALAVAFYPGCAKANSTRYAKTSAPLVMYLGELDDWTDPQECMRLGQRIGAEVEIYADSYHGFDEPNMPLRTMSNIPRGQRTVDVHQGSNPQARRAAYAHLFQKLSEYLTP